jgi:MFS family permease
MRATLNSSSVVPAGLLFVSGAAALVYQTLWVKQLGLVVGVDVYAVTVAVSAFFAGLAVGGAVVGRWADRVRRPLGLYAALELGVAALGVVRWSTRSPSHGFAVGCGSAARYAGSPFVVVCAPRTREQAGRCDAR